MTNVFPLSLTILTGFPLLAMNSVRLRLNSPAVMSVKILGCQKGVVHIRWSMDPVQVVVHGPGSGSGPWTGGQ